MERRSVNHDGDEVGNKPEGEKKKTSSHTGEEEAEI